ncbi:hypothetical protein [Streptomyces sp. NPDC056512]|uniref:hypothetical protein n=1 Tax=Streptomyces sp. NPDC056512 TaxID=3345846 RepID=UPI0036746CAF
MGAGDIDRGDVLLAGGDIACGTIVAATNAVAMASPDDRWAVASAQVIAALAPRPAALAPNRRRPGGLRFCDVAIELPGDLIELERAAWTEIQEGRLTVATALAVQQAIGRVHEESGESLFDVEMAL